jgi:hypothetical protein
MFPHPEGFAPTQHYIAHFKAAMSLWFDPLSPLAEEPAVFSR